MRRGYKRATVATAHKLLRTVYYVLRNREVYRDPHTDYEKLTVKRNAPRWIRMLKNTASTPPAGQPHRHARPDNDRGAVTQTLSGPSP